VCGEPIEKIERPHRFIAGLHDRCKAHAAVGSHAAPVAVEFGSH
jgi:hypothetical protein